MSFKRLDPEDVVLSSELVTTPTWYSQDGADTADIKGSDLVQPTSPGESAEYYKDFYSKYKRPDQPSGSFDEEHSKCLMSVALAIRPSGSNGIYNPSSSTNPSGSDDPTKEANYIIFGQYRSLVLGDEDSEFRFGSTRVGVNEEDAPGCKTFFAISVDRARFREKIDPNTCQIEFDGGVILAPDITANERYLDSGRVFDLAQLVDGEYKYPKSGSAATSFGYFLSDIGVLLLNAESLTLDDGTPFSVISNAAGATTDPEQNLINEIVNFTLRSQETVTSNYVFARARNAEFNYSTNPSNITGSAGNIRWPVMINQPQTFITTIGLYNDSNELLAVGKLSKPLVKDFTREALIRLKLDY